MRSRAGHRKNLLNPRATAAGVGMARTRDKTYFSWVFYELPPTYPDCPAYRRQQVKKLTLISWFGIAALLLGIVIGLTYSIVVGGLFAVMGVLGLLIGRYRRR